RYEPRRQSFHHAVGQRDAIRVADEKPKSDGRAQGLDLGNREALPPMSVGMAPRAPAPMIMEEIRMEALLGPRGGQLLHRGFREEVKDSVGKGLSIRGRQEEPSLRAEDPARLLEEPPRIVEVFEDLRRYDGIEGTVS